MIALQMDGIKFVVDNSSYVSINKSKINDFVDFLTDLNYIHWSKNLKLQLNEKEWILLCFIVESLNFCFWQEPRYEIIYENKNYTGSMAMLYSIINAVINKEIILDANELKKMEKYKFIKIFTKNTWTLPMIDERYNNFMNTVNFFAESSNVYDKLFSFNNDIDLVNYIVSHLESFDDKSLYKGKMVLFNKRATLLVNDLYNVSLTIRNNIGNIDNLSGCADYGIPQVLRDFGILEYSKILKERVDNEIILEHNGEMEIEIRANMLYCIELIKEELLNKNILINSVCLDNLIWWVYKKNKRKKSKVHHTITIYY